MRFRHLLVVFLALTVLDAARAQPTPRRYHEGGEARQKLRAYRDLVARKFFAERSDDSLQIFQTDQGAPKFVKVNDQPHEIHEINKDNLDVLYQGDIALSEQQLDALLASKTGDRHKRQAFNTAAYTTGLWDFKGVPYEFDSSISESTKREIEKALAYWESTTCITFQKNNTAKPRLHFFKDKGCWSYIGKVDSFTTQDISIGSGCEFAGIIEHEVAHALGFFHAQSRYDRDDYVEIDVSNLDPEYADNFDKETPQTNNNFGLSFDYGSIMMYSDRSFALDSNRPTVIAKKNPLFQRTMGNRLHPAFSDVVMMNKLYSCERQCSSTTPTCYNGGFANPKDCSRCVCPHGFGGDNCGYRKLASNGSEDCGANLQATSSWQNLRRSIGKYNVDQESLMSCHWFLIADRSKKVEVRVNRVGNICAAGCFYGATEFKMGRFNETGYRMCCKADVQDTPVLRSDQYLAVVSLYTLYDQQEFDIDFRAV